jgi:antitoxin (DNA-binding transcriptional repressor) of toxin-antitoxin stability system
VALIDPETGKPTRIKYEVRDGQKVRIAKSGKVVADPQWTRTAKAAAEDNQ